MPPSEERSPRSPWSRPSLPRLLPPEDPQLGRANADAGVLSFSKKIKSTPPKNGVGKGVYQFADKYGANVDGYSPIYTPEEWSPSGDVYVGGKTRLFLWAVTLAGILLGGALLSYDNQSP
ncbi:hypothetical protein VPH35_037233 [Triticum aestivum]